MSMDAPISGSRHPYRRIAFISTGRADGGIYEPILKCFAVNAEADSRALFLLAGGTHHSPHFGHTIHQLPAVHGVELIPVDHHVDGDDPAQVAASAGRAVEAFSTAIERCRPDLIFVLGDRTEMLAAAVAAVIHRVPIAHLHGGESTLGAVDDACRHAITKLAHVHFTAAEPYARRIRSMNEADWRIHVVGAPALDRLVDFTPISPEALRRETGLDFETPTLLIVFHPETLSPVSATKQIQILLQALEGRSENLLIIGTNADVGHRAIGDAVQQFIERRPAARIVPSLPTAAFWSCLSRARAMIGNSSSGILEAPSFRLPVVNIGGRQNGRIRAANIIDAPLEAPAIIAAVDQAASPAFEASLQSIVSPFGEGQAATRIHGVVQSLPAPDLLLAKRDRA